MRLKTVRVEGHDRGVFVGVDVDTGRSVRFAVDPLDPDYSELEEQVLYGDEPEVTVYPWMEAILDTPDHM